MATYNGEKYLAQQINSLLAQTNQDFVLYINDDVSTDNTLEIAQNYAQNHPDKIQVTQNKTNTGNAKYNFLNMIVAENQAPNADYIMLCDQDDIWLPTKIEKTLAKMKEMEAKYPQATPLLVHTDLSVVNQDLNILHNSFKHATKRDYDRMQYRHIVTINNVTGCTAMYNRALANLLVQKPSYTMMHDWWLQLVAASLGKIDHVDEPTMLYRQHEKNTLGAKNVRSLSYKLDRLRNNKQLSKDIHATFTQAESLLDCHKQRLSETQIKFLERYKSIPTKGKLGRILEIVRLRVFMKGLSRNIAFFMFV